MGAFAFLRHSRYDGRMFDILYESCPWHTRVALFDDMGRLLTLRFDDPSRRYIEGALAYGRVRKIVPALNAAFVDIGDVVDGFLPLETLPKGQNKPAEGSAILVRIVRGRTEGKGAKLDARVASKLPENPPKPPALLRPPLPALRRALMDAGDTPVRVWVLDGRFRAEVLTFVDESQIFQLDQHEGVDLLDQLDSQLEAIGGPVFPIPGGGEIRLEMTRALTSIDIDYGSGHNHGALTKTQAVLDVNLRAAEEVARLCRLLDLGGSVVVDFITMRSKPHRQQVQNYLEEVFRKRDSRKIQVLPMSRFGLLELNRERGGESMPILLGQPAYAAGAKILSLWRLPPGGQPVKVQAVPDVADILKARLTPAAALAYLGRPVEVTEIFPKRRVTD